MVTFGSSICSHLCPEASRLPGLHQYAGFLLAFFLDFFEIAFIIIPLIGPAAEKLGIDLIWLGVMLGVNMQTSFMHPPFGFALFYSAFGCGREPYKDQGHGQADRTRNDGPNLLGGGAVCVIQCVMVGW